MTDDAGKDASRITVVTGQGIHKSVSHIQICAWRPGGKYASFLPGKDYRGAGYQLMLTESLVVAARVPDFTKIMCLIQAEYLAMFLRIKLSNVVPKREVPVIKIIF